MKTIEQLAVRQDEIKARLREMDREFEGRFTDEAKKEWNDLNDELEANKADIKELKARRDRLAELDGERREDEPVYAGRMASGAKRVPENIYDVTAYRQTTRSDDEWRTAIRDGALKAVEHASFPQQNISREDAQGQLDRLLRSTDDESGTIAKRVLETSSPTYMRAFFKHVTGKGYLTGEEQRALGVGSQGGNYPVPITLDPTVILTSVGVVNPLRQIARNIQITGNVWNGVASTGVSAGYSAEFTETSDNSPTFTQLVGNVEKAQMFAPFSIEVGEDFGQLQEELAVLFQDAKNSLESTKFLSGAGHSSQEPQGLLVGATTVYTSAGTATFAVADLYGVTGALPPRWQPRASIIGNIAALNAIRQFDTAGGASLWVQLGDGTPSRLLDHPTYQYSAMSSATTTTGSSILTIGDFSQYAIIDRVGMDVELIPQLFATANNRPYGARGLYCHWRNTALVTAVDAFRTLKLR